MSFFNTHRKTGFFCCSLLVMMISSGCNEPEVPDTPVPDAGVDAEPPPPPLPPQPETGPCDVTMSQAMQVEIRGREKTELGGHMTAESTYICQKVAEGQPIGLPVTLQPGKCYSIIGFAYPEVTELDLFLKLNLLPGNTAPQGLAQLGNAPLAQDMDTGVTATIGKGQSCYQVPVIPLLPPSPIPARVEAVARTGSGPVAFQVYSK